MTPNTPDPVLKPFVVTRTVQAPRALVFDVWTQKEHLGKWFGPKGVALHAASLDLRVGGVFHYSMAFPGQGALWGKWVFREIVRPEKIVLVSSFSNESGEITRNPWNPEWPLRTLSTTTFTEEKGATTLRLEWLPLEAQPNEIAAFNQNTAGMEAGWKGTLEALTDYLASITK